jgi:hypothetical protein
MSSTLVQLPLMCSEDVMNHKEHGTAPRPVQTNLLYGVDGAVADRICCFNRHYAEPHGDFLRRSWIPAVHGRREVTYFDSVTGKPLFVAPRGRTFEEFVAESKVRGMARQKGGRAVVEKRRVM